MKTLQIILISALLTYCFSDDADECSSQFKTKLEQSCGAIDGSCSYRPDFTKNCISINNNDCSTGNGDENYCNNIFHKEFPKKKCVYIAGTKQCEAQDTTCSDFNTGIAGITFGLANRELCKDFKTDEGNQCLLSNALDCRSYSKTCTGLTSPTCETTLLDYKTECFLDGSTCKFRERTCSNSPLKNVNEQECHELKSSSTPDTKKCVFTSDGQCLAEFINCASYIDPVPLNPAAACNGKNPLILKGNYYYRDISRVCKYITPDSGAATCQPEYVSCESYNGDDSTVCPNLKVSDSTKMRCVYDPSSTVNICKEEYKSCQIYNDNVPSKNRDTCENIILSSTDKRCIYIMETDNCIETDIYNSCEAYKGTDRFVCESIKSSNNHAYCVLEADLTCKEREFLCSEAYTEEDCLFYAKPFDSRKRCIFDSGTCHEVYVNCEDYLGNDEDECDTLELYNGKKCVYESNRCRSRDKVCREAISQDECKLIAKTGVQDPNRKVCDYVTYNFGNGTTYKGCVENYKYCSDYRGEESFICTGIKPYDKSGNYVDETSECQMKDEIGDADAYPDLCQRISKGCSAGDGNPIRCASLSSKITDNHYRHCVYIGNDCKGNYKKCEDVPLSTTITNCAENIPENYLTTYCEAELDTDNAGHYKCVTRKGCYSFNEDYYENLCHGINTNCSYDSSDNSCTMKTVYDCDNKIFYTVADENEEICKSLEVSSPNYICTLNADKTACEEILKNSTYSSGSSTGGDNSSSSGFISFGIHFIISLLGLLI